MASTMIKIAYFFFFVFLSVWVIVLLLACFRSGAWANPVRFSDVAMVTLFLLSGGLAAGSCAIIGIDYLGISFRLGQGNSIQSVRNQTPVVQKSRALSAQECRALVVEESRALVVQKSLSDTANNEKLQEPSAIAKPEEATENQLIVLVLPPTEEEDKTKKNPAQAQ